MHQSTTEPWNIKKQLANLFHVTLSLWGTILSEPLDKVFKKLHEAMNKLKFNKYFCELPYWEQLTVNYPYCVKTRVREPLRMREVCEWTTSPEGSMCACQSLRLRKVCAWTTSLERSVWVRESLRMREVDIWTTSLERSGWVRESLRMREVDVWTTSLERSGWVRESLHMREVDVWTTSLERSRCVNHFAWEK